MPRRSRWHFGLVFLASGLLPALGTPLRAATIVWGAATTISADADVSTSGGFLYAYRFTWSASPPATATTLNGVTFTPFPVDPAITPITLGNTTLTPTQEFDSTATGAGAAAVPFIFLSSNYRELLGGGMTDFGRLFSLSVGGLTIGQTYRLQIWSNCSGPSGSFFNNPSVNAKSLLTAGSSVTLDMNSTNAAGGIGQWVIGTFTANSTAQTVSFSNVSANDTPVLNAFQLRVVPEPSASVLLCSVALAFSARRGRKEPFGSAFGLGGRRGAATFPKSNSAHP